jgi:hypothetical protein
VIFYRHFQANTAIGTNDAKTYKPTTHRDA